MPMAPRVVVAVVGAGWAGLSAARTYLRLNPDVDITIFDNDSSVGGVWSASRIYPGLVADSPKGLFEFSDLSMLDEDVHSSYQRQRGKATKCREEQIHVCSTGLKESLLMDKRQKFSLIRGEEVHNYLHEYAQRWDLTRRIRLRSQIVKAERLPRSCLPCTGWRLILSTGEEFLCDKLIVASGLYSRPSIPKVSGLETFNGLALHSKSLGQQHRQLCNPTIGSVTVVGGCKSALEAINLCLALPQKPQIHWVIRRRTHGVPILINNPSMPFSLLAANNMRLFCAFSPSIYDTNSWLYQFLHSGRYRSGNLVVAFYWWFLAWVILLIAGYDSSKQGEMIKPDPHSIFRSLPDFCLLQKGNPVLEEIHSGRVKIHIGKLHRIAGSSVLLEEHSPNPSNTSISPEETIIQTDSILWCTGAAASAPFFSPAEASDLGLPVPIASQSPTERLKWDNLQSTADAEVVRAFPRLANYAVEPRKEPITNYRMYQQILSPKLLAANDRTICFVGFVSNTQTAFASELTGLWGVAWMEGLLTQEDLPNEADMEKDVARVHAWMSRRYGSRGNMQPGIILEVQSYLDRLIQDLGCHTQRKGGLREWIGIYSARDYEGLLEEVVRSKRKDVVA